ncbi:hypothetical protein CXG81DRAFT_4663, partial [Caulochytrium protostelioides]
LELTDQFEWDLACKRNHPERFAERLCHDLRLPPEFVTAIAHAIREQLHMYAKSLLLLDHRFDGAPFDHEELAACFLPPLVPCATAVRSLEQS